MDVQLCGGKPDGSDARSGRQTQQPSYRQLDGCSRTQIQHGLSPHLEAMM